MRSTNVAGHPEHEEALRKAYPDATSVECDGGGPGQWATLIDADGHKRGAKCPGCAYDDQVKRIGALIPPRFRASIGVPAEVMEWVERGNDAEGLYLAGPVGTGKTHTAWHAVGHWCLTTGIAPRTPRTSGVEGWSNAGPTIIFTRMVDLLDDLRPGDSSRQRVRDCQNAKLLVIDDIGAEKASEWTQERLYSVIDHRYANQLPLIVTSNLPPSKLADQTGDRVASRLMEMCQLVAMTGGDRRGRAA
jgi:DNA replication protein DnaC